MDLDIIESNTYDTIVPRIFTNVEFTIVANWGSSEFYLVDLFPIV